MHGGLPLDGTRDIVEASIWCAETTHLSPRAPALVVARILCLGCSNSSVTGGIVSRTELLWGELSTGTCRAHSREVVRAGIQAHERSMGQQQQ